MINAFGQFSGYSINRTKLINTCIGDPAETTKASQQTLTPFGANPVNIFQA